MCIRDSFSGLWAGREGSLLFWAWLISIFNVVVAVRAMKNLDNLDCMALFVSNLVLTAFVAVCLLSLIHIFAADFARRPSSLPMRSRR